MSPKKTTRITVERDRVWILRLRGTLQRAWCESCNAMVEVVSVEQACAITGATSEEVRDWTRSRKLHLAQGPEQGFHICFQSLVDRIPVLKAFKAGQGS